MIASDGASGLPLTPSGGSFAPTRWTLVLRARGESAAAQAALGELCESYYAPVLAFIRYAGGDAETARDLAQEFFARLLAQHGLDTVEPSRGRFRSFLLATWSPCWQRRMRLADNEGSGPVRFQFVT